MPAQDSGVGKQSVHPQTGQMANVLIVKLVKYITFFGLQAQNIVLQKQLPVFKKRKEGML